MPCGKCSLLHFVAVLLHWFFPKHSQKAVSATMQQAFKKIFFCTFFCDDIFTLFLKCLKILLHLLQLLIFRCFKPKLLQQALQQTATKSESLLHCIKVFSPDFRLYTAFYRDFLKNVQSTGHFVYSLPFTHRVMNDY